MRQARLGAAVLLLWIGTLSASGLPAESSWPGWIEAMKARRLGPFDAVRWFCADGTVLPPTPYACRPHGGGRQHGQRGEQAESLRAAGVPIANVLAELSPEQALEQEAARLKAVLVEQHLMALDDGWIFRQARFARGAFQVEAEVASARRILRAMAAQARYTDADFLLLREAVRRLPGEGPGNLLETVRNQAAALADQDPAFAHLRNKIHSQPDVGDAEAVRGYADRVADERRQREARQLADNLVAVFTPPPLAAAFAAFGQSARDPALSGFAARWQQAAGAEARLDVAAAALALLRIRLPEYPAAQRIAALELSLAVEQAAFAAGRELAMQAESSTALSRLQQLGHLLRALHGTGLLTAREYAAAAEPMRELSRDPAPSLGRYRAALAILARPPVWAANRLNRYFGPALAAFRRVEPRSDLLIPDRLRAGPALSYGALLESLTAEADALAGLRHELFGRPVATGLRALNPGLARGPLRPLQGLENASDPTPAVVLAPESAADLPAVAGILTAAEGNALSHVQLLARNLGVPNVVVAPEWLERVQQQVGQEVVLAASPAGVVRLALAGPEWAAVFPPRAERAVSIRVDMARLDLAPRLPRSMTTLRADDSGRTVGPKAAKLGELAVRFPDQVSPGVAIPFGAFRAILDRPHPAGGSLLDWMRSGYARLRELPEGPARQQATSRFLAELRAAIGREEPAPEFRAALRQTLAEVLGPDGSYGVFVRSDTNVEDLPGFTGAGLNLTVPNVVGFEAILEAVRQVWASPFTERAYGWRQALMDRPEELYVAVLLHRTVPADKSGVMITADLQNNDPRWVTVATNEGVGGGVEGQAAESLRIRLDDAQVEWLASATEPRQRVTLAAGGTAWQPALAPPELLQPGEIAQLLEVARGLPQKYPALADAQGRPAPADIEFAFVGGQLYLNQIRPFLQSDRARSNAFLLSLDAGLAQAETRPIRLDQRP